MTASNAVWLIVGAEGRLGRALRERLAAEGVRFVAMGRADADLSQPIDLARLQQVRGWPKFDVVVNCVGLTDVDAAESQRSLATRLNAEFVAELADFCTDTDARLIQISTNYVFDGSLARPYLPDDSPAPLQHYGVTKLQGEQAVLAAVANGARAAIVRTVWLYGVHESRPALVDRIAQRLINGEPVQMNALQGVPTWAADVAEYLVRLAALPDAEFVGVHHALAAGSVSWHDFALQIANDLSLPRELVQLVDASAQSGAERPVNGLLVPTAVAGYAIPHWLSGWQRFLPEFRRALGR